MDKLLDYMVLITHELMDVCWNIAYLTNTGPKNVGVRKQRKRKISDIFICPKHKVRKINYFGEK